MKDNHLKELMKQSDFAYRIGDYKRLIELCDEILKTDSECQTAMGYKGVAHCFLNQYEEALEILEKGIELYPENYYFKNNISMVYYDLGQYEKSLECCEEGLKIKNFDWLHENKIKALIMLDRTREAIEFWKASEYEYGIIIEELLIEGGKYIEALECHEDDDYCSREELMDLIKQDIHRKGCDIPDDISDYFIDWIYKIRCKVNTEVCPYCGGEVLPILWGYPDDFDMKRCEEGKLYLGGCDVLVPFDYHCKDCGRDFFLGHKGLAIQCDDENLRDYVKFKIDEITDSLKTRSRVFIKSRETLKRDLKGFDDAELDAYLSHLIDLGYLCEPRQGHVRIVGFDDLTLVKEYLDEGKFAAPLWLAYPEFSSDTIGWRMGRGETYAMNMPHHSKEYRQLFPVPQHWLFNPSKSRYKPHPLLGYFWREDGMPKYSAYINDGIEVNDIITLEQYGRFQSDTFIFQSIEHAVLLSKYLHFKRCDIRTDLKTLEEGFELSENEEDEWQTYHYSVLLNATYFRVMQDDDLIKWLLGTGDEPLLYTSGDVENLFGRALMEIRDEIRRICKNENLIDWGYTEYLKVKPWDV